MSDDLKQRFKEARGEFKDAGKKAGLQEAADIAATDIRDALHHVEEKKVLEGDNREAVYSAVIAHLATKTGAINEAVKENGNRPLHGNKKDDMRQEIKDWNKTVLEQIGKDTAGLPDRDSGHKDKGKHRERNGTTVHDLTLREPRENLIHIGNSMAEMLRDNGFSEEADAIGSAVELNIVTAEALPGKDATKLFERNAKTMLGAVTALRKGLNDGHRKDAVSQALRVLPELANNTTSWLKQ